MKVMQEIVNQKPGPSIMLGQIVPSFMHPTTLVELFNQVVAAHSTQIALEFQDQKITYQDLDHWSTAIAQQLQQQQIGTGNVVGVWWSRSMEVHAIILGIIKSGAAYLPMDAELPQDRVTDVLSEAQTTYCFSQVQIPGITKLTPVSLASLKAEPSTIKPFQPFLSPAKPTDTAYIIYTSGTTGKPKGIPITHQQIGHFVQSENSILGVNATDRVYQGFSISFDMWCEEAWISYTVGATLVMADHLTAKAIDELPDFLRQNTITVLHAVPSLLAVIDADIPTLRLINAGGEACTPFVLGKWASASRKFFNSYGPTETTVSAAIAQLKAGDPISIGQPLPNYNLGVINEAFELVPFGTPGELIVTGPGLSNGYLNRPELNKDKFIDFSPGNYGSLPGNRFYRTGDAVTMHSDLRIEFHGRVDDQIKLRGYRIELGEIEAKLVQVPNLVAAAVAVRKDASGNDVLVGYYIPAAGFIGNIPRTAIEHELSQSLPNYMVPGAYMELTELPRLASGKLDRKKLPTPPELATGAPAPASASAGDFEPSALPLRQAAHHALARLFPNRAITDDLDFFHDLGGHSLLAASFVSLLRNEYKVQKVSLRDVYQHRKIGDLLFHWEATHAAAQITAAKNAAAKIAATQNGEANPQGANANANTGNADQEQARTEFANVSKWRYYKCWIAQSLVLPIIYGIFGCQIFFPYLGYYYVQQETHSHFYALLTAFCFFCFIPPILILLGIASKWLLIGKFKEGDYPLWGSYYFKMWVVKTTQELVPIQFLNNTPLYPIYLRMLGAKVASSAQLSAIKIGAEDLITIGEDVSISSDVHLNNIVIEDGWMKVRSIHLGNHTYIGTAAVVAGDTRLDEWAELKDISYLPEGSHIQKGEVWAGSPAKKVAQHTPSELPQPVFVSKAVRQRYAFLYFMLLLVFPLALLIPFFPVIYSINELDNNASDYNFTYMLYFPLLALLYHILFITFTVLFSRLLMRKIHEGTYPIHSPLYVRKWLTDQLMSLALIVLHPLYATVYIRPLFRALGAKVGKGTEISTASNVTHALLEIGDGAFVADAVKLGESDVRAQQLILSTTTIGNNSFVGNSAVIPQGYHLPENTLIGVLSAPPNSEQMRPGVASDWFGSPAIELPKRQASAVFSENLLNKPSTLRYLARAISELIRIIIPETVVLCLSVLLIAYGHGLLLDTKWWQFLLIFPWYYLGFIGIPAFLVTLLLKWLLVGQYKPKQMPIWTFGVWKSEATTVIYEALAVPFLLNFMKGTPWLPIIFRFLGVKTGKRVYMNTTDITEFDCVNIGNDVALNYDCGPQTHLFEDRVMKIGKVHIGDRSSIGTTTIILYDSNIESDVNIKPLSLVMKGENLGQSTQWSGSPVAQINEP